MFSINMQILAQRNETEMQMQYLETARIQQTIQILC